MAQPSYGLVVDLSLLGDPRTPFAVLLSSAEAAMLRLHLAELERQRVMDLIGALPRWCPDHLAPQTAHALTAAVRRHALDPFLLRDRFLAIDLQLRVSLLTALWIASGASQGAGSPAISEAARDGGAMRVTPPQLAPSNRQSPPPQFDPFPHPQSIARLSPNFFGHLASSGQQESSVLTPHVVQAEGHGSAPHMHQNAHCGGDNTLGHAGFAPVSSFAGSPFWEDTVRRVFDMTHPSFFSPQMYAFGRETDRFDAWAAVFRHLGTTQSDPEFAASLADVGARITTSALLAAAISEFCHKVTVASQEVNAVVHGIESQRPPGQASTSPEHLRTRAHLSRYAALVYSAGRASIGRETLVKVSGGPKASEEAKSECSESSIDGRGTKSSTDGDRSGSVHSDTSRPLHGASVHSAEGFASVHSVEWFPAVFSHEATASVLQSSPPGSPGGSRLRAAMDLISGGAGTVQVVSVSSGGEAGTSNEAVNLGSQTSNAAVNSGNQAFIPIEPPNSSGQAVNSGDTTRITDSDKSAAAIHTLTGGVIGNDSFSMLVNNNNLPMPVLSPADVLDLGDVFDRLTQVAVATSTPVDDQVIQGRSPAKDIIVAGDSATQDRTGAAAKAKKPALARKRIRKPGTKPRTKAAGPKRATKATKTANKAKAAANEAKSANEGSPGEEGHVVQGSSNDAKGGSESAGYAVGTPVSASHLPGSSGPANAGQTLTHESIIDPKAVPSSSPLMTNLSAAYLPVVPQALDSTHAIVSAPTHSEAQSRSSLHARSPSHAPSPLHSVSPSQAFALAQTLSNPNTMSPAHTLSPAQSASPPQVFDSAHALASAQRLSPTRKLTPAYVSSETPRYHVPQKYPFVVDDSQKSVNIESAFENVDVLEFDELESSSGDTEPQATAWGLPIGPNDGTPSTQNMLETLPASGQAASFTGASEVTYGDTPGVTAFEAPGVDSIATPSVTPSIIQGPTAATVAPTATIAATATPETLPKMENRPSKKAKALTSESELKSAKMVENGAQSQSGNRGSQARSRQHSAGANPPKTRKRSPDGVESKPRKRGRPRKTKASEASPASELANGTSTSPSNRGLSSVNAGDAPVTVNGREISVTSYGPTSSAPTVFATAAAQSAMSTLANDDMEAYTLLSQTFNAPHQDPDADMNSFSPSEASHTGSYDYRGGNSTSQSVFMGDARLRSIQSRTTQTRDIPMSSGNQSHSMPVSAGGGGAQSHIIALPSGGLGTYYAPPTNRNMTSQDTPVSGTPLGASRGGLARDGADPGHANGGNPHSGNNATAAFYSGSNGYMNGNGQTRSPGLHSGSTQYTDANSHTMSQTNGLPVQAASVPSPNSWPFALNSQSRSVPSMHSISPYGPDTLLPSPENLEQTLSETRLNPAQFQRITAASQANARRLHQEPEAYGPPLRQPPAPLSGWQASPTGSTPSLKSLGTTSSIPSSNVSTSAPSFPPPNQQTAGYEAATLSSPGHPYSPQIVHSSQGSPPNGQTLPIQNQNSSMQSQGLSGRGQGSPLRSQGSPLRSQMSPSRLSTRPSLYSPFQAASPVAYGPNASLRSSNDGQSTTTTVFRHAADYVYQNGPTSTYEAFFSSNEPNLRPSQEDDAPLMTQAFQ